MQRLNLLLADVLDLAAMTKQAHWNVRGPFFFARHELFDRIAENLRGQSDEIAERIGQLGGRTQGTLRQAAGNTELAPFEPVDDTGQAHVAALVDGFATFTKKLHAAILAAGECDDVVTEDLLTETHRQADLDLWFLHAHLEGRPLGSR